MQFRGSISAKVLVWLAAVLVPVQSLSLAACNCGSHSAQATSVATVSTNAAPVAKCPHCKVGTQARRSCCVIAAAANHGSCSCGTNGACCCGKSAGTCQCAKGGASPAPANLPIDSRTDNAKSLQVSCLDVVTAPVVVPSLHLARAAQAPSWRGSTSLERLTTLCRLVI